MYCFPKQQAPNQKVFVADHVACAEVIPNHQPERSDQERHAPPTRKDAWDGAHASEYKDCGHQREVPPVDLWFETLLPPIVGSIVRARSLVSQEPG